MDSDIWCSSNNYKAKHIDILFLNLSSKCIFCQVRRHNNTPVLFVLGKTDMIISASIYSMVSATTAKPSWWYRLHATPQTNMITWSTRWCNDQLTHTQNSYYLHSLMVRNAKYPLFFFSGSINNPRFPLIGFVKCSTPYIKTWTASEFHVLLFLTDDVLYCFRTTAKKMKRKC